MRHAPLATFVFVLSVTAALGETFIGPTTSSNRLVIQTNEVIAITANNVNVEDDFPMTVILRGATNEVPIKGLIAGRESYFVAGPAEIVNLVDESHGQLLLTFHRMTNGTVQSIFVTGTTNVIAVGANQTIHLLPALGPMTVVVERGTNWVEWEPSSTTVLEFTGPLTLRLSSYEVAMVSYYFLESGFVLPGMRAAAGPSGSFEIAVEKSLDLTNWIPVLLHY